MLATLLLTMALAIVRELMATRPVDDALDAAADEQDVADEADGADSEDIQPGDCAAACRAAQRRGRRNACAAGCCAACACRARSGKVGAACGPAGAARQPAAGAGACQTGIGCAACFCTVRCAPQRTGRRATDCRDDRCGAQPDGTIRLLVLGAERRAAGAAVHRLAQSLSETGETILLPLGDAIDPELGDR